MPDLTFIQIPKSEITQRGATPLIYGYIVSATKNGGQITSKELQEITGLSVRGINKIIEKLGSKIIKTRINKETVYFCDDEADLNGGKKDYVVVDGRLLGRTDLTSIEKVRTAVMLTRFDRDGTSEVGNRSIKRIVGTSLSTVQKTVAKLDKLGLITRSYYRPNYHHGRLITLNGELDYRQYEEREYSYEYLSTLGVSFAFARSLPRAYLIKNKNQDENQQKIWQENNVIVELLRTTRPELSHSRKMANQVRKAVWSVIDDQGDFWTAAKIMIKNIPTFDYVREGVADGWSDYELDGRTLVATEFDDYIWGVKYGKGKSAQLFADKLFTLDGVTLPSQLIKKTVSAANPTFNPLIVDQITPVEITGEDFGAVFGLIN